MTQSDELKAPDSMFRKDEQPLRDQLAEMRMALEEAHAGNFSVDLATGTIAWSEELHRIYGVKAGKFGGRLEDWLECVLPEDRSRALADYQSTVARVSEAASEFRIRRLDNGEVRWLRTRGQVLFDSEKCPLRMVGISTDLSESLLAKEEMRTLQEQLRHAQKMEAIGRLTGGVAHDFNNILMVIRTFTEMVQRNLPSDGNLHHYTQEVLNASARAAGLTTQLLAFSRKQMAIPTVLNLNREVNEATKMLKRLIGEDVQFQVVADESLWSIRADADQIVQVLMNLCINSRDAMPQGGTITIEMRNSAVSECGLEYNKYVVPGEYVVLSVKDTGTGVSEENMEHIFDPFFTTKPVGGGTGIGLATVYGIVKQGNGYIWVNSQLGEGTKFTIYFPRAEGATIPAMPVVTKMAHLRGIETVLVVEDETPVREAICEFLRLRGYTVLSANTGEQALLISGRTVGTIDLLITDMILPRIGGGELSRKLIELQPRVKVIYMSGDADRSELNISGREYGKAFLLKPFSLNKLADTMRDLLTKSEDSNSEIRSA